MLLLAAVYPEIHERRSRLLARLDFFRDSIANRLDAAQIGNNGIDVIVAKPCISRPGHGHDTVTSIAANSSPNRVGDLTVRPLTNACVNIRRNIGGINDARIFIAEGVGERNTGIRTGERSLKIRGTIECAIGMT